MFNIIDPEFYMDRLEKFPKLWIVSADDEYMMPDWSALYWDQLKGEKHLQINPNAVHI